MNDEKRELESRQSEGEAPNIIERQWSVETSFLSQSIKKRIKRKIGIKKLASFCT
jgi:hypothetical protein